MIIKEIFSKFKDKLHFVTIPGVFQDQGHFQGLFKVCANPVFGVLTIPSAIGLNYNVVENIDLFRSQRGSEYYEFYMAPVQRSCFMAKQEPKQC